MRNKGHLIFLGIIVFCYLSCQPSEKSSSSPVIKVDTLQFAGYNFQYGHEFAFFINHQNDTVLFLSDSAIQTSAVMRVFRVEYVEDSVHELGEGTFVKKFRLKKMQLLEKYAPWVNSSDQNKQTFFDLANEWPVFAAQTTWRPDRVIAGIVERHEQGLQKYVIISFHDENENEGNPKWIRQKEIVYECDFIEFIEAFTFGTKDNMDYVYFSTIERKAGTANAGIATISLNLYDFDTLVKVRCEGSEKEDNVVDCTFDESLASQEIHPVAYKFLSNKAKECDRAYNYNNYGMDDPRNFEKKWELDNATIKNSDVGTIIWKMYKTSPITIEPGDRKIENDSWIVYSFFRNSIIAFDKTSNMYFPVYAESCNHMCDKSIAFAENGKLEITWTEDEHSPTLFVDLSSGNYERIQKED